MRVPASKSQANRELVLSALASGRSEIDLGDLDPGDDVRAMRDALAALGCEVVGGTAGALRVSGLWPSPPARDASIHAEQAGTVARFVTALGAALPGRTRVDGSERLRVRPMAALTSALRQLGAAVEGDALPVTVSGPLRGGAAEVPGHESSQFASALLLVGARAEGGIDLRISGTVVSAPFVELTLSALARRGVKVVRGTLPNSFHVAPQEVARRNVTIEGDATAATYPAAAAAVLGGKVTVANVDARIQVGGQGDVRYFELLARMGCRVSHHFGGVTVRREGPLYGIRADMRDISDTFPSLAVVAACAEGRSELLGLGHTRRQESDRIAAVAAGLRALGGRVTEYADGLAIDPVPLHGGVVDAAGDHRIAMAFSILGLQVPGVSVEGSESVGKTFPDFYEMVRELGH